MFGIRVRVVLIAVSFATQVVHAEKVLIPVAFGDAVPGAHGSLWTVELAGYNAADRYIQVKPYGNCAITCPAPPAFANSMFSIWTYNPSPGPGWYLYVNDPEHELIFFNLRVRDISRQLETWGTEIPVVRESEVASGRRIVLLGVPNAPEFRTTLRIYDLWSVIESSVRLLVYDEASGALLGDERVSLTDFGLARHVPTQAQRNDFSSAFPAARVRVEIVPENPESKIWAFISVTHDETQHVTTITPQ
ncbi:MAG TPA: hypothetical protein VMS56_13810 [Thermoanaerobaculia bacterium]|nr:hypothetical protein [Thermoanaerobaculia bacterium]